MGTLLLIIDTSHNIETSIAALEVIYHRLRGRIVTLNAVNSNARCGDFGRVFLLHRCGGPQSWLWIVSSLFSLKNERTVQRGETCDTVISHQ